jgi:DNA-binding transcriptional LysR family regulator
MQSMDRIGRRIKLRDLRVLVAVAHAGSISRAADHLAISHPVVSRTIADLEHTLGVRLFDRSSRGVEPTPYGLAFLDCGIAMFDDLRSGLQRIEFLSGATSGEVRVGGTDVVMSGFIAAVIERLARRYPKMVFQTDQGDPEFLRELLRQRKVDLIMARRYEAAGDEDLVSEDLFEDPLLVAAGPRSRWTGRRRIKLSELRDEPWIMPAPGSALSMLVAESFRSIGLAPPASTVMSNSIPLRNRLLATGRYLSFLPRSILHFGTPPPRVRILPVSLPGITPPIALFTLRNRTLNHAANLFIEQAREAARSVADRRRRLGD